MPTTLKIQILSVRRKYSRNARIRGAHGKCFWDNFVFSMSLPNDLQESLVAFQRELDRFAADIVLIRGKSRR